MSTVDIDKQVREIMTRLFTYGVDWTEYRDKGGPNGDHDIATYAAKIKADFANEIANELVQLFATQRQTLKAELLAKMPKLHECDKTCYINSREWIAGHQGYRDAEKNTITEITKILEEL